ncbi:hypothetical protein FBZ89_106299 [Nitrospirillum amazonense]|uniref:EVE domain-containing protein n=1 Tax=Nitrospirillum amazonense TaxID=28077 RepID=A0A560FH14_9PROT|nr:hypothetical protein [Nitrospirillum amazonense]TWB20895.1 hypothetical protein FBZ89_106299 [Nitrospirillum amazonense]
MTPEIAPASRHLPPAMPLATGMPGWVWVASVGAIGQGRAAGDVRLPVRHEGVLRRVAAGDRVACFAPDALGGSCFLAVGHVLPGGRYVEHDAAGREWACLPVAYLPSRPVPLAAVLDGALAAMGWGLSLPVGLMRLDGDSLDAIVSAVGGHDPDQTGMAFPPVRIASLEDAD